MYIFIFPTLEFESETALRYVRIYMSRTPFVNRITKDRAATFVDMLSTIGGTMGLLTGFSLISGAEILYFCVKIVYRAFKKKFN